MTPCCSKPLHRLTDRLEHIAHRELREELSLVVALAVEESDRPGSQNAVILREFRREASRLLDTVTAHFRREETRLFPEIRLAEDGLLRAADRLSLHLREMRRGHAVLRMQLDLIRDLIDRVDLSSACPLVEMLFGSLAAVADNLERHLDDEERAFLPHAWMFAAQEPSPWWVAQH